VRSVLCPMFSGQVRVSVNLSPSQLVRVLLRVIVTTGASVRVRVRYRVRLALGTN